MLKLSVGHYLKSTFLVFKHKDDKDFLYQFQEEIFIFVDKELDKSQKRLFVHSLLTYIFAAFKFEPSEVRSYLKILNTEKMVDYIKGSIADHLINEGKEIGKEQGMKIKEAIISLRSLLLLFPLYPNFPLSRITKIANVKGGTVKNFYKELVSLNPSQIKKAAIALLFKKIKLAKADEEEINRLIKDFLKNNSKSRPS